MIMGGIAFLSALSTPGDLVSHVAHLGGMAFGYLYLRGRPLSPADIARYMAQIATNQQKNPDTGEIYTPFKVTSLLR